MKKGMRMWKRNSLIKMMGDKADDEVVDSTDVFRKKKVLDRTFRDKMTKHTGVA
ncbi:hypothetical protein PRIPAC_90545 [Pristionchus pacificus]|nr:hypothetical protein PRIPAC_90545 [Pristionchus pacificus]